MAELLTIFVFGSIWFWGLVLVASMLVIWALEYENWRWAGGALLTLIALIVLLGNLWIIPWLYHNPWWFAAIVAGYFAIGVPWGFVKCYLFLKEVARSHWEQFEDWGRELLERQELPPGIGRADLETAIKDRNMTTAIKIQWVKFVKRYGMGRGFEHRIVPPLDAELHQMMVAWGSFWPWSAVWTIINDPVRKAFSYIFDVLGGWRRAMVARIFRDITPNLEGEGE